MTPRPFDWDEIPFYTLLNIFWHLSPRDIENFITAFPTVLREYKRIEACAAQKFIFNSTRDDVNLLRTHKKLRRILLCLRYISKTKACGIFNLLCDHPNIQELKIHDSIRRIESTTNVLLCPKFEYLTILTIESQSDFAPFHNIKNIIWRCPNLKELTYSFGYIESETLDMLPKLKVLRLRQVHVPIVKFNEFLVRSKDTLEVLQYVNDPTAHSLYTIQTRIIYEHLPMLTNLKELTIMAIHDFLPFENLDAPTHMQKLTIIAQYNSCLPKLYIALTQVVVNKIDFEEWMFKHCRIEFNQTLMERKIRILKNMLQRQSELNYYILDAYNRTKYNLVSLRKNK